MAVATALAVAPGGLAAGSTCYAPGCTGRIVLAWIGPGDTGVGAQRMNALAGENGNGTFGYEITADAAAWANKCFELEDSNADADLDVWFRLQGDKWDHDAGTHNSPTAVEEGRIPAGTLGAMVMIAPVTKYPDFPISTPNTQYNVPFTYTVSAPPPGGSCPTTPITQ